MTEIPVVVVWRRVHNEAHIKPDTHDVGEQSSRFSARGLIKRKPPMTPWRWLVVEVVPWLLVLSVPVFVNAGLLRVMFASEEVVPPPPRAAIETSPQSISLLNTINHPDPLAARGGGDVLINDGALVSQGPVSDDAMAAAKTQFGEISVYVVREGDTLSQIAEMYDVTTNTILWANDLASAAAIRPGDTLVILPIVGVRYTVKKGDTISGISDRFGGDAAEILAYNQLASLDEIAIGDTLVIPGGEMSQSSGSRLAVRPAPVKVTGNVETASSLSHPLPGAIRTQGIHGYNGVDLAAAAGTAIRAAASGEVIVSKGSGWNGGYGNYVVIKHPNGLQTLYAHNSSNVVGVGAWVSQGEVIAYVGSTGRSTGDHLHFEVRGAKNPF